MSHPESLVSQNPSLAVEPRVQQGRMALEMGLAVVDACPTAGEREGRVLRRVIREEVVVDVAVRQWNWHVLRQSWGIPC